MSSQDQSPVEAAASLFTSQNESAAELFDSYFSQTEDILGSLVEPSHDPSTTEATEATEASSLFDAGVDGDASFFSSHDPSLDVFSQVELTEHAEMSSVFEPGTQSFYEKENVSGGYYNPDTLSEPVEYANQSQNYGSESYQLNDTYSLNYHESGQINQWTTYTASQNEDYSVAYASQTATSPQYSQGQQMYHNTSNQGYTPSSPHSSGPSISQYPSSNGFMSFDAYNHAEPAKPLSTTPAVAAYRPKTTNAYDPPIPTKSRTKSRYATPNSSLNYTSFQNQTYGTQPHNALPPQPPMAFSESQNAGASSLESSLSRSEFEQGYGTLPATQVDQVQQVVSTVGVDETRFERETNPHSHSFSEYLHSEAEASFPNQGSGYAATSSNFVTEVAKQEAPLISHSSDFQAEPHHYTILPETTPYVERQDLASSFKHSYDPYAPYAQQPNAGSSFHGLQIKPDQIITSPPVGYHASKVTFLPISSTTQTTYAPSPTLIGANDPLGRAPARVPVVSFGFGGKLVLCYHLPRDAGGFDVSLNAHQTTFVMIRPLTDALPVSAMGSNGLSFPGPLFSDPGASSLARTVGVGIANQTKNKKAVLVKWLDERAIELANGLPYIASGSSDRYKAEGRLVLLTLLKVMVENDGQLSGNSSIEWAVRSALVPRLREEKVLGGDGALLDQSLYTPYLSMTESTEQPMAVHYANDSSLDRIKEFLIRGEKVKAYHFAMDEKLWAHAMLIANSVDAQSFKEVTKEFIHSELGLKHVLNPSHEQAQACQSNGKESLRVAYSLFSGHGASSIQELFPTISSNNVTSAGTQFTPVTPSFLPLTLPGATEQSLVQWQETLSMIFTQSPGDSAALTSLGDHLAANGWFDAAHSCYLLSPRSSSFGGVTVPSVRMVLIGSENPIKLPNFHKDLDVTLLSEIAEFALSLSTLKGQDPFSGLPHLQAYKLLRAYFLAEMGYIEVANRYCEAIGNTIRSSPRGSQFYTPAFIDGLKNLSDRLTAIPQSDKSGSWISRTMAKPSFDTIGSWLEGRFSKIIVGEGEEPVPSPSKDSHAKATYGPFSHYSSISSAAPSAPTSRSATPYATTNAVLTASMLSQNPIDRASSAIDYARLDRRRASPVQRVASANAIAPPVKSQVENSISHYRTSSHSISDGNGTDAYVQENTWWGSSGINSSDPTPRATEFNPAPPEESAGEFISLMDSVSPGFTPSSSKQPVSARSQPPMEVEEEDLGFGNSSIKKVKEHGKDVHEEEEDNKEQPPKEHHVKSEKPATKPKPELVQQSSSWFGGLWTWKRGSSQSPAPTVANLGEEKSFYYDKELKRWVNKNAPDTSTASSPPPPPPRPKTASPSIALSNSISIEQSGTPSPPPPRSSSAAEHARKPPRVRSNLVPKEDISVPSSAPPVPNSFDPPDLGNGMPPTNRSKSSAGKRNVRNRYVDVFQQSA